MIAGLMLLLGNSLQAQVAFIEVETGEEMDAAIKKADDAMLMLFVDVYASWCGPCKMMDRDVYTDPRVADYMNARFVSVRMDGESDFGRNYASRHNLKGYPSMFVFSDKGDMISTIVGYRNAENLVDELELVAGNYKAVKRYRAEYDQGIISGEDFADYVRRTREMGNEELADILAADYMKSQMGEHLNRNDIAVVAYYTDLEDPWWPQFTMDPDMVKNALESDYINSLERIYNNTLVMAIDNQDIGLISRMANELSPLVEAEQSGSRDLRSLPFLQYYYYTDQLDELTGYVDQRYASDRLGDHRWLFGVASQIIDMDQQYQTPELMARGEVWMAECLKHDENYDYLFYYGISQLFQKKPEQAKESFLKAASMATTEEQKRMVDQVLGYVNRNP